QQPAAAVAVLEQVNLAARALVDGADAGAHRPLVGLRRLVAADAHVDERLARQRADQRVALPFGEQVAAIDQQRARAHRRVPPHLRRLEAVAGTMIRNVRAVVVADVRRLGPPIILARLDEVDLVAALRAHLGLPQPSVRGEGQSQQVAMAEGGIATADPLSFGRHVDDLAEIDIRVLRRCELEALAAGDEQRAVGREGDALRIMLSAMLLRLLAPDRLVPLDPRLPLPEDKAAIADGRATGAVGPRFGKAEIDALVAGEIR